MAEVQNPAQQAAASESSQPDSTFFCVFFVFQHDLACLQSVDRFVHSLLIDFLRDASNFVDII